MPRSIHRYLAHLTRLIVIIIMTVSPLLASIGLFSNVLAESPSFPRQEVINAPYDWGADNENGNLSLSIPQSCLDEVKGSNLNSYDTVSYSSNGTALDVAIWLSSPFKQHPLDSNPAFFVRVWVNPDMSQPQGFYDYGIEYNGTTWLEFLDEHPLSGFYTSRTLFSKPISADSGSYFEEGGKYIHLSLDLSLLGFPKVYVIEFLQHETNMTGINNLAVPQGDCPAFPSDTNLLWVAVGGFIYIPPTEFGVSISPAHLELRPNEEQSAIVTINSTAFVPVLADISIKELSPGNNNNLDLNISSNIVTVPAQGSSTLLLNVHAKNNAEIITVPVSLNATIRTPRILADNSLAYDDDFAKQFSQLKQTDLSVIMKNPLTIEERWTLFWNAYGGLISFVGAGFAAGFATMIFRKFQKNGGRSNSD